MKKLLALTAALLMSISTLNTTSAATTPAEQMTLGLPPTSDRYNGIWIDDSQSNQYGFSVIEAFTSDAGNNLGNLMKDHFVCKGYGIGDCTKDKFFTYSAQLGMCTDSSQHNCVLGLTATKADGTVVQAKYVEDFPGKSAYAYTGVPEVNLPSGDSNFLVEFPGITHNGGNLFYVAVRLDGFKNARNAKFEVNDFKTAIIAVSKVASHRPNLPEPESSFRAGSTLGARAARGAGGGWDSKTGKQDTCANITLDVCALPWTLPTDVNFSLNLKLSTKVNGWLNGHISNFRTEISTASDGDQLIKVSGNPTIVPTIAGWYKKSELPESIKTAAGDTLSLERNGYGVPGPNMEENGPDGNPYSILNNHIEYNNEAFKLSLAWLNALKDTAYSDPTAWSFRSVQNSFDFARCQKNSDALSGAVSSNATVYVASPPTYNKAEGTLEYKVLAPHFLSTGSVFKGEYDLQVNSEFARCIYGYTSAPVSATVSVVSTGGDNQVATSLLSEKDGWLTFSVKNFTFSNPTIKIKLTQTKSSAAKQITITCVKGKTTKKVTAVKPVCPAGYKKK